MTPVRRPHRRGCHHRIPLRLSECRYRSLSRCNCCRIHLRRPDFHRLSFIVADHFVSTRTYGAVRIAPIAVDIIAVITNFCAVDATIPTTWGHRCNFGIGLAGLAARRAALPPLSGGSVDSVALFSPHATSAMLESTKI